MKLQDYLASSFDHSNFNDSYDNDNDSQTIASEFLVPALKHCKKYRRTTYSFTSAALKSWSGSFANIISDDVQIEIICDMCWHIDNADEQLKIALINATDEETRKRTILELQDNIILTAWGLDNNPEAYDKRGDLLDYLVAKGSLKLKFAWPKSQYKPNSNRAPLYHKKKGYFTFADDSIVAFKGSWNETSAGAEYNDEDVDVFSSLKPNDVDRLNDSVASVDRLWAEDHERFDFYEPSKTVMKFIKDRAPDKRPTKKIEGSPDQPSAELPIYITSVKEPEITEEALREYQTGVLEDWELNNRMGLVEHATGTGKTWTAIFAMKRHLCEHEICLVIVPSDLLQKQWKSEVSMLIPQAEILCVGGGYKVWKQQLQKFSQKSKAKKPKIIISILKSAASNDFISKLNHGPHLMMVIDEVHSAGSSEYSKVFSIDSGARMGLSATPQRYGDPVGTEKIYSYFKNVLKPIIALKDVIPPRGSALVPYDYFPHKCYLSAEEQEEWLEYSNKIKDAFRKSPQKDGVKITSNYYKMLLIQRSRIAKKAASKIPKAIKILKQEFKSGDRWLVYCDSIEQLDQLYDEMVANNLSATKYHSKIDDAVKTKTLDVFSQEAGILLSIKCLDEGVDIPSITHALIIASDQNPRQFIQRRGRILRRDDENNKKQAYLHDLIISGSDISDDSTDNLIKTELMRSLEFSASAKNQLFADKQLRDIARASKIDITAIIDNTEEFEVDKDDE
jgi:superfamily II DNA or RNA helicase